LLAAGPGTCGHYSFESAGASPSCPLISRVLRSSTGAWAQNCCRPDCSASLAPPPPIRRLHSPDRTRLPRSARVIRGEQSSHRGPVTATFQTNDARSYPRHPNEIARSPTLSARVMPLRDLSRERQRVDDCIFCLDAALPPHTIRPPSRYRFCVLCDRPTEMRRRAAGAWLQSDSPSFDDSVAMPRRRRAWREVAVRGSRPDADDLRPRDGSIWETRGNVEGGP
jgi:hypothetical protein